MRLGNASNTKRSEVLRTALELINGERERQYGPPRENLQRIANYWNLWLSGRFELGPGDVAMMMLLAKVAREHEEHKHDSSVDIAGYAALLDEVASTREES